MLSRNIPITFLQEPSSRMVVKVELSYLDHFITLPDNAQKREVESCGVVLPNDACLDLSLYVFFQ